MALGLMGPSTVLGVLGFTRCIATTFRLVIAYSSQAIDNAMLAGSPMVQPEDERSLENFAFNYFGPFAILPPNMKFVDRAAPNTSQTMMPVMQ